MHNSEHLVISDCNGTLNYNRTFSNSLQTLQNLLTNNYSSKTTHVTSSGLSAISTLFNALFLKHKTDPINIVYSSELYYDTPDIMVAYRQFYSPNSTTTKFDPTNNEQIINLFNNDYKNQTNVLFVEACSNPNGYIFDFSIIPKLRELSKLLYVIVDNTWLTEIIFNGTTNIDFMIVSLTKYYSAGNAIGGAIMSFNDVLSSYITFWIEIMGQHVSPINCDIIYNNIICEDNMERRIVKSSNLTLEIINELILFKHPKMINIIHPSRHDHPSYDLAIKYFNNLYPSVFMIIIDSNNDQIQNYLENNNGMDIKTSFGSKLSKIDPCDDYEWGLHMGIRLSIGYNDDKNRVVHYIKNLLTSL